MHFLDFAWLSYAYRDNPCWEIKINAGRDDFRDNGFEVD